ncbi:PMS1 protein homolog 1 isoform X2 [Mixophyes fleayi]
MSEMHHLPSTTISLLSSSQVITAVVSVVKELVENALDACATSIEIKLDNFGLDKIEVRDNGKGIKAADTPVMGMKHYTSKITSHEDLETIETYGFRGEALGSICAVSEVHITTKTTADEISTHYVLDSSGHIVSQKPSHLGHGTTVSVIKLFKNLPVRKHYYSTTKKCKEELRKIQDLLMAYGIIKPDVRIVFIHNKVVIWQKAKVSDHKMAFMSVLGIAVVSNMVSVQHQCDDAKISINGYLPTPEADSTLTGLSSPERSFIFINQRPVHNKDILKISNSLFLLRMCSVEVVPCDNILKMVRLYYNNKKDSSRCYPIFFMNIVIPTSSLDVNVIPDKSQVMLHDKESVLQAVESVLKSVYSDPLVMTVDKVNIRSKDIDINSKELANTNHGKNICIENGDPEKKKLCQPPNNNGEIESQSWVYLNNQLSDHADMAYSTDSPNFASKHESQNYYGLSVATSDDRLIEHQTDTELESHSIEQLKGIEVIKNTMFNEVVEPTDDAWSKGSAFMNSRSENLQPVKILCPLFASHTGEKSEGMCLAKSLDENTDKKITNVMIEKSGFITPYDLMSNKVVKKPMSAMDIFVQEQRVCFLNDKQNIGFDDISSGILTLWEKLSEDEKLRYEEKAAKDLHRYKLQTAKATGKAIQKPNETGKRPKLAFDQSPAQNMKLKSPLSNQQILDKLFISQVEKKTLTTIAKNVQVDFNLSSLKRRLYNKLPEKEMLDSGEITLMCKLNFPDAWIIASKKNILLLNPYRVEEVLLYKRLVDNHNISAEKLDSPIELTDRLFGAPEYLTTLIQMQKDTSKTNGHTYFSDLRLCANGFHIKVIPGLPNVENRIEIEGMARSLPFYGVSDLKEILRSVMNKHEKLCDCRPLKVLNYLEGEAVRLTRQLPLNLSKDDVNDTVSRMKKQLGSDCKGCLHGHPFVHHLTDIPEACD